MIMKTEKTEMKSARKANIVSNLLFLINITASSTSFVSDSSLVANHNLMISGLATSTTYRLKTESRDATGNTATSTEFSLTTSAI